MLYEENGRSLEKLEAEEAVWASVGRGGDCRVRRKPRVVESWKSSNGRVQLGSGH